MTTRACVYINGDFLCHTVQNGHPHNLGKDLGENLYRYEPNWRSVLLICKESIYQVDFVNIKYFNKDPEFVYNCLYETEEFPKGLTPEVIHILKKGDPDEDFIDIFDSCPNELYARPYEPINSSYQYNVVNNSVFVRYKAKNFPWVPNEEANELDEISTDMCGFIDNDDLDGDIIHKVWEDGPINSGRHFIRACKKATQLLSLDPNSWWNYAVSLELAGRLDQAFDSYKKAIELTPNNPIIWLILGNAYLRNNYREESYKAFEKTITYLKDFDYSNIEYWYFHEMIEHFYKTLMETKFDDLSISFRQIKIYADIIKEFNT